MRANERGNRGKARGDHDGVNGTLGEDRGARGGADRTAMSRWPKVEEDSVQQQHNGVVVVEEAAGVGVKTGGSRVGGPNLCVKADGNKK